MPSSWVRMYLGVMAMKEYSTFPEASASPEHPHLIVKCHRHDTCCGGVFSLLRDAVDVFCCPHQAFLVREECFISGFFVYVSWDCFSNSSVKLLNKSIRQIEGSLTGTATSVQSQTGSNGNQERSDSLLSFSRHLFLVGGLIYSE